MSRTRSGIRTHEANATDLKSVPFDHSGIRVVTLLGRQVVYTINMDQFFINCLLFATYLSNDFLHIGQEALRPLVATVVV